MRTLGKGPLWSRLFQFKKQGATGITTVTLDSAHHRRRPPTIDLWPILAVNLMIATPPRSVTHCRETAAKVGDQSEGPSRTSGPCRLRMCTRFTARPIRAPRQAGSATATAAGSILWCVRAERVRGCSGIESAAPASNEILALVPPEQGGVSLRRARANALASFGRGYRQGVDPVADGSRRSGRRRMTPSARSRMRS